VGHAQRLRIIAGLAAGRVHVSELARRLELSRPLLYMHLDRLEKAGLVTGRLELSADGKAMKYFELAPFELHLTVDTIVAALHQDEVAGAGHPDPGGASRTGGTTVADDATEEQTAKRKKNNKKNKKNNPNGTEGPHDMHDVKETPR
jgi:DNA-binding transcriptional ArsR family regulator